MPEFINKEGKWFNYIRGFEDAGIHDNVDTGEFSLQGLGYNLVKKSKSTYTPEEI